MFELAWPWVLAAAPIPLIVRRLVPAERDVNSVAIRVPFFAAARAWGDAPGAGGVPRSRLWFLAAVWTALLLAGARPQLVGDAVHLPVTGREMVLAIDVSGSMGEVDGVMQGQLVDRLTAVKQIAGDFLERRVGDRVGIVLFGSRPYLQVPLTFDLAMTRVLLKEAVIGLAGNETAIGDAIGLSVQILRERPVGNRVLVLLTDGENTVGSLDPMAAARLAALHDVRIHTIRLAGARTALAMNSLAAGSFEQRTLRNIAALTGGVHFRAESTDALTAVYSVLDQMEPAGDREDVLHRREELFHWPLGVAYLLSVAVAVGSIRRARRLSAGAVDG